MTMTGDKPDIQIWTPGGFISDQWTHHTADGTALPEGNVIVPVDAYRAAGENRRGSLGVLLQPGDDLDTVVAYLQDLPIIALAFPAFSDGRSYSKAALLRGRHGYNGILRATGDILIDQVELMIRTGFDQLEISHEVTVARLKNGLTGGIAMHSQPAQRSEQHSKDYSWRRMPAA